MKSLLLSAILTISFVCFAMDENDQKDKIKNDFQQGALIAVKEDVREKILYNIITNVIKQTEFEGEKLYNQCMKELEKLAIKNMKKEINDKN